MTEIDDKLTISSISSDCYEPKCNIYVIQLGESIAIGDPRTSVPQLKYAVMPGTWNILTEYKDKRPYKVTLKHANCTSDIGKKAHIKYKFNIATGQICFVDEKQYGVCDKNQTKFNSTGNEWYNMCSGTSLTENRCGTICNSRGFVILTGWGSGEYKLYIINQSLMYMKFKE